MLSAENPSATLGTVITKGTIMKIKTIQFPSYTGVRCLMMPYIQGCIHSVPKKYISYTDIIKSVFIKRGDIGYLTIDESLVKKGCAHRANRAKFSRAIHTEAGRDPNKVYTWGSGGGWGKSHCVTLDRDVQILIANNIDNTCALWDKEHENTSIDGDIGHLADDYPYEDAKFMKSGEVHQIGILTPHESLPIRKNSFRQFLRIVSSGVHGREPYFTQNPLIA